MKRLVALAVLAVALPAAATAATVTVTVSNFAFNPATVNINTGDTVHFLDQGGFHNATADDNSWNTPNLSQGQSADVTFPAVGTFGYYCTFHGAPGTGMFGTVMVATTDVSVMTWGKIKALFR